ncbi:hypothetical protein Tco_0722737 [Tanacetum coccineum]
MYERHRDLVRSYTSRKSVAPMRNRILVYPDSDKEDEEYCSLPPVLPCFQTPQPCATFNSMHHNSNEEVDFDNMTLEEYARYEVAMSRVKSLRKTEHEVPHRLMKILILALQRKKEEVPMEDDEIDDDVDHSNTNEALQWSFAKDPFLVCMELNEQSSFVLHTIPSSISNEFCKFSLQGDEIPVLLDSFYVVN